MDPIAAANSSRLLALVESGRLLHASLDLNDLLNHLLRSVMGNLLVRRAMIGEATGDGFRVAAARGCPPLAPGGLFDLTEARAAGIDETFLIGDPERPLGLLGLGHPARGALSDDDREFLMSLLGLAAGAIANARAHAEASRLNRELERRVLDLTTLLDLGRGLTSALEPEDVAQLLNLTLAGQWAVRKFSLLAWKDGHPLLARQKGFQLEDNPELREAVEGLSAPARVCDLLPSPLRFALESQGAVLAVPLRSAEKALGVVALGPSAARPEYQPADLDFISGLAAQAVVALENAWNFKETVVKKNLEREIMLAQTIQQRLFPEELPTLDGYQFAALNRPAKEVGGDYYDAVWFDGPGGKELLCCVADVSGKGIAASLLMSNFQATLRALLLSPISMADLAAKMNDLVWATTPSSKYVTAFLLRLNPATGEIRYVNAGHNDGMLVRNGGVVERLKSGGTPIGLLPDQTYEESSVGLEPADLLFLFSDGVNEAQNVQEEEFDFDRLQAILVQARERRTPAQEVVQAVFTAVDRFAGAAPQYDDITGMAILTSGPAEADLPA